MKKKIVALLLLAVFSVIQTKSIKEEFPFSKVVIWGHKLHSHTHSWIHWAFYRAFKHLGYDTYWLDNTDAVDHLDLSNSLFITEGQVDQNIPIRSDCKYILHNCRLEKYKKLWNANKCIVLQVYTHDVLKRNVTEVQDFIFTDIGDKTIYMPWATDLLPDEIDENKEMISSIHKKSSIYWVGTITDGTFGNMKEINAFKRACQKEQVRFVHQRGISMDQNIHHMQESYMAPAIVGTWQKKQGYIPCRIFKNISYGQIGITNSETVHKLFKHATVYNPDTYQLFYDSQKKLERMPLQELYDQMDFVRDYHTYLNRIELLLTFLELVASQ